MYSRLREYQRTRQKRMDRMMSPRSSRTKTMNSVKEMKLSWMSRVILAVEMNYGLPGI